MRNPFPPRREDCRGQLAKRGTSSRIVFRSPSPPPARLIAAGRPAVQSACRQLTISGWPLTNATVVSTGRGCRTRPRPVVVSEGTPMTPRVSKALTGDKREKGSAARTRPSCDYARREIVWPILKHTTPATLLEAQENPKTSEMRHGRKCCQDNAAGRE